MSCSDGSAIQCNGGNPYCSSSPIIIDLDGSGFRLTNVVDGVLFDVFAGQGNPSRISWTALGSTNAWLVLDRNGNGLIDDFSEMFGNLTPQPVPPLGQQKNGFLALAVFDQRENGGNNDGWISDDDAVFRKLRVWVDANHDGVSQPDELHTLSSVGIKAISLSYELSSRTDQFGNRFRYKGIIRDTTGGEAGKTIYDVFLLSTTGGANASR